MFIAGAVKNSGSFNYIPGRTADSYVSQAVPALTAELDRSLIKRADGTLVPYLGSIEVGESDAILTMEQMFKNWQEYFAAVGAIAGILLTGVGLAAAVSLNREGT